MAYINRQTDIAMYQNADMALTTFGERLRWARSRSQYTQTQLAAKTGIKQSTISELENDRYEGSAYTPRLAWVLGVSGLWLAEGEGEIDSGVPPTGWDKLDATQREKVEAYIRGLLEAQAKPAVPAPPDLVEDFSRPAKKTRAPKSKNAA